jgi:hypothetical protein
MIIVSLTIFMGGNGSAYEDADIAKTETNQEREEVAFNL